MTELLWFKAHGKLNRVEGPAETRNPEMIETGLLAVTATYQLAKEKPKKKTTPINVCHAGWQPVLKFSHVINMDKVIYSRLGPFRRWTHHCLWSWSHDWSFCTERSEMVENSSPFCQWDETQRAGRVLTALWLQWSVMNCWPAALRSQQVSPLTLISSMWTAPSLTSKKNLRLCDVKFH